MNSPLEDDPATSSTTLPKISERSPARRITCAYFLLAATWILVSDSLIGWIGTAEDAEDTVQTVKGLAFVSVTAVLLHVWIHKAWHSRAELRAKAQDALHRLDILVSNLPGVVYRSKNDPQWTMEYVSPRCAALTGYSPRELQRGVPRTFEELIDEEDRDRVWTEVQQALSRRVPFSVRYRLHHRDGGVRYVIDHGQGNFSSTGEFLAIEGYLVDVTELRSVENQLFHAQKMEAVARLASGIAHDFNNVLTGILGYVQLLRSGQTQDLPPREVLDELSRAGGRAAELARQILGFVRRPDGTLGAVSLVQIVKSLRRFLERIIGEDIAIRLELCREKTLVLAEPSQIEQIVMNLAVNSRDAMPRGGHLTLGVDEVDLSDEAIARYPGLSSGRYVRLIVTDDGEGMDESTLQHIYEPFFTTKEAGRGTGLGLSTVFSIVKAHHGAIDVQSEPGVGTRFTVFFPCAETEGRSMTDSIVESREVLTATANGSGAAILIVEDDPQIRRLLRAMLGNRGYEILDSDRGASALELACEHGNRIRLLIADYLLPDMSAGELRKAWEQRFSTIPPTLIISGYDEERLAELDFEIGSQKFLSKPFTQTQLANCVNEMIGAH